MTRVFVYEYLCSGADAKPTGFPPWASALWSEGWAMLAAAMDDLCRVRRVQVRTLLDERLRGGLAPEMRDWPEGTVIWVREGAEEPAFHAAVAAADLALVIAPEFDRLLETRCRWAADAGCRLLGPTPEAVALTADKLALARHLQARGVPTPATVSARTGPPPFPQPWVIKPRFGAGSQDMVLITDSGSVPPPAGPLGERIVQPLVAGRPASVAFLIGPRQTVALAPAWQDVSPDDGFHYRGGSLPLPEPFAVRARGIARQAVDAVAGLKGYVGVDVVLGDAADGSGDVVIEINPRLTTSYIGLRRATAANLAELMLRAVNGEEIAEPHWSPECVRFNVFADVSR